MATVANSLRIFGAGPWRGVNDTRDPYDDAALPDMLQDAANLYVPGSSVPNPYVPATSGPTGVYARPGFVLAAPNITVPASAQTCGLYNHTIPLAGGADQIRFLSANGKLYRLSGTGFSTATDVTPVGITIAGDATTSGQPQHYMTSLAGQLIFTDGANRPWRGTNLAATPITGTYIDIDGLAGDWAAIGAPVLYQGSVVFIAKRVPAASAITAGIGIVWSEPNQPDVGYTQPGYADFWNLIEQSSFPLYALCPTNNTLYYFRESSIGAIQGTPGVALSSTASRDLVSYNVGCVAPSTIISFGTGIFFCDKNGRPWRFQPGAAPEPLWHRLRGQIDANPSWVAQGYTTFQYGVGCLIPQLNIVLLGGWAQVVGPPTQVTTLYAFDAITGMYYGRWSGASTLANFNALAPLIDTNGNATLGALSITGSSLRLWTLALLSDNIWTDNAVVPTITAKTQRLGYQANVVWNASDVGTVITQSTAPLTITVQTPNAASTTEATALAPNSSSDGTYRAVFGMDVQSARGIQLTVQPTTAPSQWVLQRVEFSAVPAKAGVEEQ